MVSGGDQSQEARPERVCSACFERKPDVRIIGCGCYYCRSCLQDWFQSALRDRSSGLPSCHDIPLSEEDAAWTQDDDIFQRYRLWLHGPDGILEQNLISCANPECQTTIELTAGCDDVLACPQCEKLTCRKCLRSHPPDETGCDKPDSDLEKLRLKKGWAKCPHCARVILRVEGCNHIICRCGKSFCYHCGAIWGACGCDAYTRWPPRDSDSSSSEDGSENEAPRKKDERRHLTSA